jgi:hypothetical protein
MIVVAVLAGAGAAGTVGVLIWRWRHPRPHAARAVRPPLQPVRAAQPLLEPQRRAIEQSGGLHLHLHGISAEEIAAIIERHRQDG